MTRGSVQPFCGASSTPQVSAASATVKVPAPAQSSPIGSGSAPFSGTFRPDQLLSAYNGGQVGGAWKLVVTDTRLVAAAFCTSPTSSFGSCAHFPSGKQLQERARSAR